MNALSYADQSKRSRVAPTTGSMTPKGLASMCLRTLLAVLLTSLVVSATASARSTIIEPPDSHWPFQGWIDRGLLPTPEITVSVIEADPYTESWPCGDNGACVNTQEDRIAFSRIPKERAIAKRTFWHEMGHEFDAHVLNDAQREDFMLILGFRGVPWWGGGIGADEHSAGEEFANSFADCATLKWMWAAVATRTQRRICRRIEGIAIASLHNAWAKTT